MNERKSAGPMRIRKPPSFMSFFSILDKILLCTTWPLSVFFWISYGKDFDLGFHKVKSIEINALTLTVVFLAFCCLLFGLKRFRSYGFGFKSLAILSLYGGRLMLMITDVGQSILGW
jgi:hypothetical protein